MAAVASIWVAAVAQATPAAGGNQIPTTVTTPNLVSATVANAATNSVVVCFDKTIQTFNAANFRLVGYDSARVQQGATFTGVILNNGQLTNCGGLTFPSGANDPSVTDFTTLTATQGAATTPGGAASLQGATPLTGTAQAPRQGNTAGPDLVGTPTLVSGTTNTVITYTFDQQLDTTFPIVNGDIGYFGSDGTYVDCKGAGNTATISGNTVVCTVPAATAAATPPTRFQVNESAVENRPTTPASVNDTSPLQAVGGGTTRPEVTAVTQNAPNQFTLTYDAPVSVALQTGFRAYFEDSGVSSILSQTATEPVDATHVVVTFPTTISANNNYKIVGIGDYGASGIGGAVQTLDATPRPSTASYLGVRTAPITGGFTDAPDLRQVTTTPGAGTATFQFDGLINTVGAANLFHLVNVNGTLSNGVSIASVTNDPATSTGTVIVNFNAGDITAANGNGATVDPGAVTDFEPGTPKSNRINTVAFGTATGSTVGTSNTATATSSSSTSGTVTSTSSSTATSGTSSAATSSTSGSTTGTTGGNPCAAGVGGKCSTNLRTPAVVAVQHRGSSTIRVRASGLIRRSATATRARIACTGTVRVAVGRIGSTRRITTVTAKSSSSRSCGYNKLITFSTSRLPRSLRARSHRITLRVFAHYYGNSRLRQSSSPTKLKTVSR